MTAGDSDRRGGGGTTLATAERERLERTLRTFDARGVRYVVLRGFADLPTAVGGRDVDLFVDPVSFEAAVAVCGARFERGESVAGNAVDLLALGLRHPRRAVRRALTAPGDVAALVRRRLVTSEASDRGYVARSFEHGDLVVDLANHLAYTSPLDGSMIRVDPRVDELMLDRRTDRGWGYAPSPPDELAHLVCRGVFDYDGAFPARHATRCDHLVEALAGDPTADEQFRELLGHLFFAADALVYDHVVAGEYDEIRPALRRYADY